jgi:hypothetical protein
VAAADELIKFAWKPLHLLALPGAKGIAAGPNLRNLTGLKSRMVRGAFVAPTVRSILISSGRFISLPQRQPPLNILKESLSRRPKAMHMSERGQRQKPALQPCGRRGSHHGWKIQRYLCRDG